MGMLVADDVEKIGNLLSIAYNNDKDLVFHLVLC